MNITQHLRNEVLKTESHVPLSGATSYHLLSGNLALANSVITNGFATTLYTGNGTSQSINTSVDMSTQWGNSASETFGGLVWAKGRSGATNNYLVDTIRGATHNIYSNATTADTTEATGLTAFSSTGFNLGALAGLNTNAATYASWVFQTTHRITGTTNHGKAYTCHYNPFTGFTMVKYEGSGTAGHEIPHHLGRKLGFVTCKNLSAVANWFATYQGNESNAIYLNLTNANAALATGLTSNIDTSVSVSTDGTVNTSAQSYILYGWANSYFDEANTLIGNYEVGVYQGTGAAGNKVTTRGKPAWVMIKRLDSTGEWYIFDNQRYSSNPNQTYLTSSSSNTEATYITFGINILADGFTCNDNNQANNASGGQYLYMVVYDNDSGSGKSKYPRATDTSTLNLNATIPFANGVDSNGTKNSILVKNETVSGLTLQQGKNYVYAKNDGTYGVDYHAPRYGDYLTRTYTGESPSVYNPSDNTWYSSSAGNELVTNGKFNTDVSGWSAVNGYLIAYELGTMKLSRSSSGSDEGAQQTITTIVGKKYTCEFSISVVSGSGQFYVGATKSILDIGNITSGKYSYTFIANSTTTVIGFGVDLSSTGIVNIDNISVFEATIEKTTPIAESRNYLNAIVYADQNGQPTYIEQLPKTNYFDEVKANEFKGKNACTAWVNFDGTTTPPTIRDSYNVKAVIRIATGAFDIYFEKPMDNTNYTELINGQGNVVHGCLRSNSTIHKISSISYSPFGTAYTSNDVTVTIFGGKN